ncbi:TonB-dependent receptor [Reichenbachiella sp. MALMAid0571]|uniref:SusC/RagA family TonB-linked outer membrane protein n=1 Tax=Reichenbachiella sp. MALMAid0571 TaxID=3143939 RepID=UPI0032DF7C33
MKTNLLKNILIMTKYGISGIVLQCVLFSFITAKEINAQKKSIEDIYITIDLENASIEKVFESISEKTSFNFAYKQSMIDKNKKINIAETDKSLGYVLRKVAQKSNVQFRRVDETIHVNKRAVKGIEVSEVLADVSVGGKVTDENGDGLPGAAIVVKGSAGGTVTDLDGKYKLDVPSAESVLVVSFVGYKTQEVPVGSRSTIDIAMEVDATSLEEIVVVGYGEVNRRDLTGAVGSIQSVDIVRSNPIQAAAALQGQVAGVNINKLSNNPGEGYSIDIRGLSNFDGSNASAPLVVIDGVMGADMNVLNPNDIESMDVLKDASSTAIYGSRGANGVIIITTKRGKSGTPKISYNSYVGMKVMAHMPTFQNAQQFAHHVFDLYEQETGNSLGNSRSPTDSELALVNSGQTTDWVDLITDAAVQTGHSLGLTGGTERTTYDFSLGYLNEGGNTINTSFKRYTIKAGMESKVHDKVKVGLTSYYTFSKQALSSLETLRSAFRARPTGTVYTEDLQASDAAGDKDWNGYSVFMGINDNQVLNPVIEAQKENYQREQRKSSLLANAYIDYTPIKGLSFRSSISTTVSSVQDGEFRGTYTKSQKSTRLPRASLATRAVSSYTLDNTVTYKLNSGDHGLTVTGLHSVFQQRVQDSNIAAQDLPYPSLWYHLKDGTVTDWSTGLEERALLSYMGRINYSFKDKYLLTVTGRSDGASQLSVGNKWQFFPSVALAWRLGDEDFIKNTNMFSDLKLRVSYGEVGNASVNPYQTQSTIAQTQYEFGGSSANGYAINNLSNKNLVWERSKELNFGINMGIMKNRITTSIEIYNRKTVDLIIGDKLPISTGFSDVVANVAEIQNSGVEILLNTVNIAKEDFTWNTNITFTKNNNKVTKLTDGLTEDIGNNRFVGEPVNALYYYEPIGIWQLDEADEAADFGYLPGQVKFVDQNNDGKITDADDRVIVGSESPSFLMGVRNKFNYKNFDLSFFVYTRQGVKWRSTYLTGTFGDTGNNRYNHDATLDYWTTTNPSTTYFGYRGAGPGNSRNSFSVVSANFVRISDITLGYTLPASALSSLGLGYVRVYAQANNPFVFTKTKGFNPEYNGNIYKDEVSYASYLFGLNVSF